MCHSERRFFMQSMKNDVRNPLISGRLLLSIIPSGDCFPQFFGTGLKPLLAMT